MTIRTAIIGLGIMGRRMAEHMALHADFEVTAIWDPDQAACTIAQSVVPSATIAQSAEAAIAQADLIYLACPPVPRKAYALDAAAAGKAIFLEKPLGVDVAESVDLVRRIEDAGIPAAVNFTQAAGDALSEVSAAAQSGALGPLVGADIVLSYAEWPRIWQKAADWLRFSAEGGMTREVISHFLFFSERILGPLELIWARADHPSGTDLCETHIAARLATTSGQIVSVMGSVGGAQPDRQEVTIKGEAASRRISDFYRNTGSNGGPFEPLHADYDDPRAASLKAQLDDLVLMMNGAPHRLATLQEALRVQQLVEGMLSSKG